MYREDIEQTEQKIEICPSYRHRMNPFHATGLFLYPLKTSENLWWVK